jgi:hypothetical protein
VEKKELAYCLELLNEALTFACLLSGHVSELKQHLDLK